MTRPLRALAGIGLMLAASLTSVALTGTGAHASTPLCDKYGSTTVAQRYVVMNNEWGANTPQCLDVTDVGFRITASHNKPTNGAPASYTAIYYGCHYGNCSPGTTLPIQVGRIGSAKSSVQFTFPSSGIYNASYDIWLDPAPNTQATNRQELMIWFTKRGPITPVGKRVASTVIDGRTFDVWSGFNGTSDVVSYVARQPRSAWDFDVHRFITDIKTRSSVTDAWYLTSIQAGFEPWVGGTGLAVRSFSAAVTDGGHPVATPAPSSGPPPAGVSPSTAPSGNCGGK